MQKLNHNEVCELLVRYSSNSIKSSDVATALNIEDSEDLRDTLGVFQHDWDSVEVASEEGTNVQEDDELDSILNTYASDLLTF